MLFNLLFTFNQIPLLMTQRKAHEQYKCPLFMYAHICMSGTFEKQPEHLEKLTRI